MYVQIDKMLRDSLQHNVLATGYMGSYAHGLNGPGSDTDILYLYYDMDCGRSIAWERNGWQFKNGVVDENYQEIRHFIRNLIIGESPADYEALRGGFDVGQICPMIIRDLLDILSRQCQSYTLIKSYLGYMKKDEIAIYRIPFAHQGSAENRKRMSHLVRAESTVRHLLGDGNYQFTRDTADHGEAYDICRKIKFGEMDLEAALDYADRAYDYTRPTRNTFNELLNSGKINRRMSTDTLIQIDTKLMQLLDKLNSDNRFSKINYGNLPYAIIEDGVTHQYQ